MLSHQQVIALELKQAGLLTARQVEAWQKRLQAAGFKGRLEQQPSDLPGLWRLVVLEEAWGAEPDAHERRGMGHSSVPLAGGRQPQAVSLTARDVKKINAFVARLEQESER